MKKNKSKRTATETERQGKNEIKSRRLLDKSRTNGYVTVQTNTKFVESTHFFDNFKYHPIMIF